MSDKIKGGLSDNLTIYDIVNKHSDVLEKIGFSTKKEKINKIKQEISMGIEVEMEHTVDKHLAREIALDHIYESPIYYTELKKMEKKSEKILKESKRFKELCGLSESEDKRQLMSENFIDNDKILNKFDLINEGFNKEKFEIVEFEVDGFDLSENDESLYSLNESVIFEMEEEDEDEEDKFFKEKIVVDIIKNAGLSADETSAFDILEAIYMYVHDFNDNTKEINSLKSLMKKYEFKARPSLRDEEDLEEDGKEIYKSLIDLYETDEMKSMYYTSKHYSSDDEDEPGPTNK